LRQHVASPLVRAILPVVLVSSLLIWVVLLLFFFLSSTWVIPAAAAGVPISAASMGTEEEDPLAIDARQTAWREQRMREREQELAGTPRCINHGLLRKPTLV
jgi:hypothetical protein